MTIKTYGKYKKSLFTKIEHLNKKTYGMNVWTFRITPLVQCPHAFSIKPLLEPLDRFAKSYIFFEETSSAKKGHVHARATLSFTDKQMRAMIKVAYSKIFKYIKEHNESVESGKITATKFSGNSFYSLKPVYIFKTDTLKDEGFLPSLTYIAKDGNCIASKGYNQTDITEFCRIGRFINAYSKKTLFHKIIMAYHIQDNSHEEVANYVINYYDTLEKPIPDRYQFMNLVKKIVRVTNRKYQEKYKKYLTDQCKDLDNFKKPYDMQRTWI